MPNRNDIERKYQWMGLKTKHVVDPPGEVYEPHHHGKVYLYSLGGSLKIRLEQGEWRSIKPGQELIIERHQLHEAVVGPDGWEYIFAWDPKEAEEYGT
jgi:quercetin dioxygenase-like cupin family protein